MRIGHHTFALSLLASLACTRPAAEPCDCEQPDAAADIDEDLYTLPGLEHGLVQSPVNILSDSAVHGRHRVALHYDHSAASLVWNKGSTIELDFPKGGGSITYDDREFELLQLHFHTPSEHLIDGVTYPMSMHIVNRLTSDAGDGLTHYLVIAVLFKMGESNDFIASFLEAVPSAAGERSELATSTVYLEELFPGDRLPRYYHYRGSLTTAPHTETVDWMVLKQVKEASPEQIQKINSIEGDNARHVQALYGREIDD